MEIFVDTNAKKTDLSDVAVVDEEKNNQNKNTRTHTVNRPDFFIWLSIYCSRPAHKRSYRARMTYIVARIHESSILFNDIADNALSETESISAWILSQMEILKQLWVIYHWKHKYTATDLYMREIPSVCYCMCALDRYRQIDVVNVLLILSSHPLHHLH